MTIQSNAQFVNYERDGGWNLGFNIGGTWQPKEGFAGTNEFSKPYAGLGGGFTLGKSLYEKEGAFLAFDLRGRYLGSSNYGWVGVPVSDSTITGDTTSMVFRNYKMKLNELSLEGVITLHRLRERTGIILYGFGGIGVTNYRVESDLYDGDGNFNLYDSSYVQSSANATATDLRFDSDNDFETTLQDNKWSLVPSLGFGLGYQITESFSIGLEHKIAYDILGDEFDGGELNGLKDGSMDKYHYTALNLRWNLLGRGNVYEPKPNHTNNNWTTKPPTNTTVNNNQITQESKPLVNIYNPTNNNQVVHSSAYTIKAKVYNVSSSNGITFKQNGLITSGFTYNPTNDEFSAQVYLQQGTNSFEITGKNSAGSDQDSRIIIYEMPEQFTTAPAPIVSFSNPNSSSVSVSQSQYNIVASVFNVSGKSNISFVVNGVSTSNFNYNVNNKTLTAAINLNEGNNSVTVKGVNSVGSDLKTVNIKYTKPAVQKAPIVSIAKPTTNPFQTNSPVELIRGSVMNVAVKSGVKVLVNGNNLTNFSFDPSSSKISFSANLIVGANVIQITGTNSVGTDSKTTTIIYRVSEAMPLPVVDFTVPNVSPYSTTASNMTLTASVLNVTSKNYITVNFNGQNLTNFSYNSTTKEVAFNVNLVTGNNVFKITGTNSTGSDQDDQVVVREIVQNQSPPVVYITNPNANPYNTNVSTQLINASVVNVDNISGVSAKFNGSTISNFTFDPVTDKFVYQANLVAGANVLEITGTNAVGTASKSQTVIYTIPDVAPCDVPTIALSQPKILTKATLGGTISINTSNSKGSIVANISNANSVDFKIDGQSSPGYNYNAATGQFESFLHLKEGANSYQIIATNDCGTESSNITYIYSPEEIPCDPPAVHFITPGANPYSYTGPRMLSISASVLGVTSNSQVVCKLNNAPIKKLYDPSSGTVSANVTLKDGSNKLIVTATNDCGTISSDLVINYTAPIAPPTVNIFTPNPLPHNTTDGNVSVKANITNVDVASGIQIFLDGQPLSNFNFNNNSKQVSFNLSLAIGSHQVIVKATNTAGSAQDNAEIIIEEEVSNNCDDPIIVMTQPQRVTKSGGNPTLSVVTEDNTGVIKGTFSNTTNVSFTVNGQSSSNFTFNPTSGGFSSTVTLSEGINNFQIVAGNSCGINTASQAVVIEYTPPAPPCIAPDVSMMSPNTNQIATTNPTQLVTIKVENAVSESQVFSKLNNVYINQSFNAASGVLTLNLSLVQGNNELVVMSKNECGSDEITVNINYTVADNTDGGVDTEDEIHDPNSSTSDPTVNGNNTGGSSPGTGNGTITTGGGEKPSIENGNSGGNGGTNNGHGNNADGVDSSNPGQGNGGPNGQTDPSGGIDDENGNGQGQGTNIGQQGIQNAASDAAKLKAEQEAKAQQEAAAKADQAAKLKAQQEAAVKAKADQAAKLKAQQEAAAKAKADQAAANEKSYNDQINKGDLYFKAGKYSTAKTYYTKALGYKPNSPYAKGKLNEIEKKLSVKPTVTKPTVTKPVTTKPKVTTPTKPKTTTPTKTKPKTTTPTKTETKPTIKPKVTPEVTPTSGKRGG